jgi:very-short-patch-repair endonuclease
MFVRLTNPQSDKLTQYRRDLRRNATISEQILWKYLKANQLGVKFRRQVSIGTFIVDFYCHTKKLVIELDGYTHMSEKTHQKDREKQAFLEQNGYTILRFTDDQVIHSTEIVYSHIQLHL